jgi:uncharacterized membrane protein
MESRARLLRHPIHQMLVVFPLGLLATAALFDVLALVSGSPVLSEVAYSLIGAGLVGALVAAPFGFIDMWARPAGTRAARVARLHGLAHTVVTLLFGGSWLLRTGDGHEAGTAALLLSFAGVALAVVTAWLGGERVPPQGVGVSDEAALDAPGAPQRSHTAQAR